MTAVESLFTEGFLHRVQDLDLARGRKSMRPQPRRDSNYIIRKDVIMNRLKFNQ